MKIQVAQAQGAELRSPRSGVVERAENAEVTVAVPSLGLDAGEDRIDFRLIQAVARPAGRAFEGNQENLPTGLFITRLEQCHHFEKRLQRRQTRIACRGS